MKILAFDTTARSASVAVAEDDRVLAAFTFQSGQTHSESLLPMAQSLCNRLGSELGEMDLYAVTTGPGSFTGVRIGVATVKGLALRMPRSGVKNCIGISTLEAIAENLVPLEGILCPVMDAKRAEVYNALFQVKDGTLVRLCPDRAIPLDALKQELQQYAGMPVYLAGDGYEVAYRALVGEVEGLRQTPLLLREQHASSVVRCAFRHALAGEAVDDVTLSPTYLRLPQAERERLARLEQQK